MSKITRDVTTKPAKLNAGFSLLTYRPNSTTKNKKTDDQIKQESAWAIIPNYLTEENFQVAESVVDQNGERKEESNGLRDLLIDTLGDLQRARFAELCKDLTATEFDETLMEPAKLLAWRSANAGRITGEQVREWFETSIVAENITASLIAKKVEDTDQIGKVLATVLDKLVGLLGKGRMSKTDADKIAPHFAGDESRIGKALAAKVEDFRKDPADALADLL